MRPASKIAPVDYGRYVVDITDGGIIIETSDGFSALTGYSDEDVLGGKMTFIDFVPDDMRDEYKKLLRLIGEGISSIPLSARTEALCSCSASATSSLTGAAITAQE